MKAGGAVRAQVRSVSSADENPREPAPALLGPLEPGRTPDADSVDGILRSIAMEFDVVMGRTDRVQADCARLRARLAEPAAAEPRPENPERFVRIAAFTWSKAVPEIVIQANLTIESALPFALKEIEVACAQFARSGVVIDSQRRTITEVLPAHGRLQVEALNIGPVHPQAGSSGCRIVNVTPA